MIIDKISPRNITDACITSVQITAFIPPYYFIHKMNITDY